MISNKLNRLPQIIYLSCKNKNFKPFIVPKDDPLKIYFSDLIHANSMILIFLYSIELIIKIKKYFYADMIITSKISF